MKVKAIRNFVGLKMHYKGDIIEVGDSLGKEWEEIGMAIPYKGSEPKKEIVEIKEEKLEIKTKEEKKKAKSK